MNKRTPLRYALGMAALLTFPVAWADQGAPMPPDPMEQPDVQQSLKLTDAQKQQLKTIHEDARAKHEAIRKETDDKVAKVLTPEQNKKWQEMRARHDERREEHMQRKMDRMEKRMDHMQEQKGQAQPAPAK